MKNPQPKWLLLNKIISKTAQEENFSSADGAENSRYFNKDISWLYFNDRVLAESENPAVPLLERLFFIGIVSSNLDEFFTVRVSELLKLLKIAPKKKYPDALAPEALALHTREHVLQQKSRQAKSFNLLLKELTANSIYIYSSFEAVNDELDNEIEQKLPEIEICFAKPGTPLPPLLGSDLHIFIRFLNEYAVIKFKKIQDRLLELSPQDNRRRFVLLERWLMFRAQRIFKNKQVLETFSFRLLRNADIPLTNLDEEDADIEKEVEKAVNKRFSSRVVRLEIDSPVYPDSALLLATGLRLDSASVYRFDLPLNLHFLTSFKQLFTETHGQLLYPPINPVPPVMLRADSDIFSVIRKQDIILHHPYDSFEVVLNFLEQAAKDPTVTEIFHTLYRTNNTDSPIAKILKKAAKNGKKVTVFVEIKARFDEINNLRYASDLRKDGVRVIIPRGKYKIHSKLTLITRKENAEEIRYMHMSTGNYHTGTAKQYTDLGLLTAHFGLGQDALKYCKMLQKSEMAQDFERLFISPLHLRSKIIKLIESEITNKKNGKKAHIIAKMNALTDIKVIEALYRASAAGVKIELIVRGICCLIPGAPGLSENIKVLSIVDRFLEHSRIYYFYADGDRNVYLSSADWRPRNFLNRYEIAFPILDRDIKQYILNIVLPNTLKDNVKASILQPDGTYKPVNTRKNTPLIRSQFLFEEFAAKDYQDTPLANRVEAFELKYRRTLFFASAGKPGENL